MDALKAFVFVIYAFFALPIGITLAAFTLPVEVRPYVMIIGLVVGVITSILLLKWVGD